jgi:transposase InsO family protein
MSSPNVCELVRAMRGQPKRGLRVVCGAGITVQRVLSDNGSGYVSRVFRTSCEALGLQHRRTRAYTPRTNGKAERFIQTLVREWAYAVSYISSTERRRQLRRYLAYYNRRRPHASLNYSVPWERLTSAA